MSSFQSLDRAIEILFVFTKAEPRLTADEIARRARLPRGSIYRYLNALMENGLIERNKDKFQLGYKLLYFQSVIHYHDLLEQTAFPYMQKVHDEIGETIQLTVIRKLNAIAIKSIESLAPVRVAPPIGRPNSLHAGANSKAILAFRPPEEIKIVLSRELKKFTENTIIDPEKLAEDLVKIRKNGYAYSSEEMHEGAWGISAPIFNNSGWAIASIGASGPLFRLTEAQKEKAIGLLTEYSNIITQNIQFHNVE